MKTNLTAFVHSLACVLVACLATPFCGRAAVPTVEAPVEAWVKRNVSHVNTGDPQFHPIKVLADDRGDVIVTGVIYDGVGSDILTIKYSGANGSVVWWRRYGSEVNSSDEVTGLAIDADGNALVIGVADAWGDSDFYTAKYASANGALLWERRYNGPANQDDGATAVATDASGNVFVAGFSRTTNGLDNCTVKYAASDGALLWKRCYERQTEFDVSPREIATDSQGNVVVAGAEKTIKYAAADGAVLWERFGATHVVVDVLNDVFVAGFSIETGTHRGAKLAATDGTVLWEQPSPFGITGLELDARGDLIVMEPGIVSKYAGTDGSLVWTVFGGGGAMTLDLSGNVILTVADPCLGIPHPIHPPNCPRYDVYRLGAQDGTELPLASGLGQVTAIVVDKDGDLIVTGAFSSYFTAKHVVANGTLMWEQHLDDQAETTALAVDASDNVVVTGHAFGVWHTAKYAASDGALIWERQGPSGAAQAVELDAAGNAVVMGASNIIKYAAANGAVLWEQHFNGQTSDGGNANAMAMDGEGNVVVTGSAGSNSFDTDFYTAKYAASDGALLWEVRYDGPDELHDGGTAIAVDADGNVVVTGYSSVGFQSLGDHYTAKYAATDGCLMWEQRHLGVAGRSLALDANGNAVTTGPSGTFKYAASDGALLWERHSIRAGGALALDSRGDVVVVGGISSDESCSGGQIFPRSIWIGSYATKYAAGDGALLWHHEDPACSGTEGAEAVVLDSHDNVVVLGTQFHAAKRSGRDGTLLWETRYTGEDSIRNEHASNSRCLALTSDGAVVITGGSDCTYERASIFIESRAFATVKYVMTQVTYPTPVVLSLALTPEGARLRFTGDAGRTYRLQRASDPSGPWSTFAALTAPPDGAVEHLDPVTVASPAFYRIAAP